MSEYIKVVLYFSPVLVLILFLCMWTFKKQLHTKKQIISKITDSINQSQAIHEVRVIAPAYKTDDSEHQTDLSLWRHQRIQTFYQKFVLPYEKIFEIGGYLKPITMLLSLLDTHGDCPSVIQAEQAHEYQAVENVYDLLAKISLLDHSLNVAEQMISEVFRVKTKDPEMIMGKILVTALGHDIGKIPGLLDSQSRKGDHPYISYLVLKNVIMKDVSPQSEDILAAIKSHHFQVHEGLTYDLRKADQAAREMEAEQLSMQGESGAELIRITQEQKNSIAAKPLPKDKSEKKGKVPETVDLSWLDLDEFLKRIEPEINRVENNGYFRAFSMNNGLVYLMLSLVSETVIYLAQKYNHSEILVSADSTEKKRNIEFTIKTMLAQKDLIPSFIGKGFAGARFGLIDANGKKKMVGIYMPIQSQAFKTNLADLEKRKNKTGLLKEITEVRPLVGRKK